MEFLRPSKRFIFKPSIYQPGKRFRRLPRGMMSLMIGIGIGIIGVIFLQANYSPQRLSIEQSENLYSEITTANLDRQRLQGQLDKKTQQHHMVLTQYQQASLELIQAKKKIETLSKDLLLFQAALPHDPHIGTIGVRVAQWKQQNEKLDYKILVMQASESSLPFKGTLQLVIEGHYTSGKTTTLSPKSLLLVLDRYAQLDGQIELPERFTARTITLRIFDSKNKQHTVRTFLIRG